MVRVKSVRKKFLDGVAYDWFILRIYKGQFKSAFDIFKSYDLNPWDRRILKHLDIFCFEDKHEVLRFLIEIGLKESKTAKHAIEMAVMFGRLRTVKVAVENGWAFDNLLSIAVSGQDTTRFAVLRYLLTRDITENDAFSLVWFLKKAQPEMKQMLFEIMLDNDLVFEQMCEQVALFSDTLLLNMIFDAKRRLHPKHVFKLFLRVNQKQTIDEADKESLRLLVENDNFYDQDGSTLNHRAALSNNIALLELFVVFEIDVFIQDAIGNLAFDYCNDTTFEHIRTYLFSYWHQKPLLQRVIFSKFDHSKTLICTDVLSDKKLLSICLKQAIHMKKIDAIKFFMEKGADPFYVDPDGDKYSGAHIACSIGREDILDLLIRGFKK